MTKLSPINGGDALELLASGHWLLRRVMNVPQQYRSTKTKPAYRETAWSRIAQENAQLPLDSRIVPSDISLSEVSISFDSHSTALLMRIENDRGCVIRVPPYDLSYEASTDERVVTVLYRSGYTLQRLCQVIREEACEHIPQTMQEFLQLAQERRAANIAKHAEQAERARDRRNAMQPENEAQCEQDRRKVIENRNAETGTFLRKVFAVDGGATIADVKPMINPHRTGDLPIVGIRIEMTDGSTAFIMSGERPGQIVVNGMTVAEFSY